MLFQILKVSFIAIWLIFCFQSCCEKDEKIENPQPVFVPPAPPQVQTSEAVQISDTSALCGGIILAGSRRIIYSRGLCWSTSPSPEIGKANVASTRDTGQFSLFINTLEPETRYYVRAFAVWEKDTSYGNQIEFRTAGLSDIDGNTYATITIGNQVWMKENLKVRHYRNGDTIPYKGSESEWRYFHRGACTHYENKPEYSETYGLCYNGFTVQDERGLCPAGWHVPSNAEWQIMIDHLGGNDIAGGKLKARGTRDKGDGLWRPPNFNASNSSGFTALPAGHRNPDGSFHEDGRSAYWWTSTNTSIESGTARGIEYYGEFMYDTKERYYNGYSMRCIKD